MKERAEKNTIDPKLRWLTVIGAFFLLDVGQFIVGLIDGGTISSYLFIVLGGAGLFIWILTVGIISGRTVITPRNILAFIAGATGESIPILNIFLPSWTAVAYYLMKDE